MTAKMSLAKNFAAAGSAKRTTKKHREMMQAAARRAYSVEAKAREVLDLAADRAATPGTEITVDQVSYKIDRKGRAVRQPTRDNQATRGQILDLLVGNRAVEVDDCLRVLGKGLFKYFLDADWLRQDARNPDLYFVTVKASRKFDLPNTMGVKGFFTA